GEAREARVDLEEAHAPRLLADLDVGAAAEPRGARDRAGVGEDRGVVDRLGRPRGPRPPEAPAEGDRRLVAVPGEEAHAVLAVRLVDEALHDRPRRGCDRGDERGLAVDDVEGEPALAAPALHD